MEKHKDVIFISQKLDTTTDTLAAATDHSLHQIESALNNSRSSKDQILKINIYVPDIASWQSMEKTYQDFFGSCQPSNAIIPTNNAADAISFEVIAEKTSYYAC